MEGEDGLRVFGVIDTVVDAFVSKASISSLGQAFLTKFRLTE